MAKSRRQAHPKRHGRHQKQTPHFLKVYWPYMPLATILIIGLFIAIPWRSAGTSAKGVLAYATNTTVDGLLQETNNQRVANGKKSLLLNSKLNSAAQSKAQDMVNRDYWSHTTPDGQQPWVFINATGYKYQKAGENLAYGFSTSAYTVAGWMNSPSHRDNMLDSAFDDVGFGIANSPDYQHTGPETVVVAMYAQPTVLASSTKAPVSSSTKKTTPTAKATAPAPTTAVAPAEAPPAAEPEAKKVEPVTTASKLHTEPPVQHISRVQAITFGKVPWISYASGLLSGLSVVALALKHGLVFKRMLINGEHFIYHHALFDVTIIAFVALCVVSAHSVGVIR